LHVAAGFYSALPGVAEVSKVTIELKGRSRLTFVQSGFPFS